MKPKGHRLSHGDNKTIHTKIDNKKAMSSTQVHKQTSDTTSPLVHEKKLRRHQTPLAQSTDYRVSYAQQSK